MTPCTIAGYVEINLMQFDILEWPDVGGVIFKLFKLWLLFDDLLRLWFSNSQDFFTHN